ncbi:uncharacterized protein LOC122330463 isoform X2 [Puntigrus tetrazona]|uniref:uncharacterized protein LOC122330463 isoform X2 n=1 Tax=Puntigrus tetrazona TaxID=1606681 RepID=UPI001C89DC02|nr:uncharacterized protein LOC122330463 isoform X2 [Puntigrus tetrazona]
MIFQILPTLQFILLFYTFGSTRGGFIIIIIVPLLMLMMNDAWLKRCYYRLGFSLSVVKTVMIIFILVTNAVMIVLYIFTLDYQTDAIGWGCVVMFLQVRWTLMFFTDYIYGFLRLSQGFQRYVAVYVFGSVVVVLLNSALITEMILKSASGGRVMADLRFIVFLSECLFAVSLMISAFLGSKITDCLKSCQKARPRRVKRSQKNQNSEEERFL